MNNVKTFIAALTALIVLCSATEEQQDTITVFTIGDSTMANKSYDKGRKERGWAMVLQSYFDDGIKVDNHAVNGRSSKSFINEGRWDAVLQKLKPGDYVFIQFGHNDEKPKEDRHTDPGSTFDANLRKFVEETRAKGATPILFNCVVRRNFFKQTPKNDDDEKLRETTGAQTAEVKEEGDTLYDTHGDYRWAPRNVAQETGTVFIDANTLTHNLEQGLGREASKKLHMWFLPGEEPSVPDGRQDNTHYNVYGANVVARLLAAEIGRQVPELGAHLNLGYHMSVSKTGRGDYMTLTDAIEAAPEGKKIRIQVLGGQWQRPSIPESKDIEITLRLGARWKE